MNRPTCFRGATPICAPPARASVRLRPETVGSGAGEQVTPDCRAQGLGVGGFRIGCASPGARGQVTAPPASATANCARGSHARGSPRPFIGDIRSRPPGLARLERDHGSIQTDRPAWGRRQVAQDGQAETASALVPRADEQRQPIACSCILWKHVRAACAERRDTRERATSVSWRRPASVRRWPLRASELTILLSPRDGISRLTGDHPCPNILTVPARAMHSHERDQGATPP